MIDSKMSRIEVAYGAAGPTMRSSGRGEMSVLRASRQGRYAATDKGDVWRKPLRGDIYQGERRRCRRGSPR
jgi:hypothetical protein